jgi:hypothetical protein
MRLLLAALENVDDIEDNGIAVETVDVLIADVRFSYERTINILLTVPNGMLLRISIAAVRYNSERTCV